MMKLKRISIMLCAAALAPTFTAGCSVPTAFPGSDLPPHREETPATVDADTNGSPEAALNGPYSVVYVIDGDTVIVDMGGTEVKIRLIGMNTPESCHPDESKNCEEGRIASNFTANLLNGQEIWLEYDAETTDQYGRTLAYVYLRGDGGEMVNKILVKEGMASAMTIPPNVKYSDDFVSLERYARENKIGLWADGKEIP